MINNSIAHQGAPYIRDFTVSVFTCKFTCVSQFDIAENISDIELKMHLRSLIRHGYCQCLELLKSQL